MGVLMNASKILNSEPLAYERGFFVSLNKSIVNDLPKNFVYVETVIPDVNLFLDKKADIDQASTGSCAIFVLGFVVDSVDPCCPRGEIKNKLLSALLDGREEFFNVLNSIGGRYVVFAKDKEGVFVVGDAGGVRSIFYTLNTDHNYISSHSSLIASVAALPLQSFTKDLQSYGDGARARNWPGRLSKFKDVFALTPNTYLDLKEKRPRRFYTLDALPERSVEDASNLLANYLRNAAENFISNYLEKDESKALLFLTSGIDSRLVLSAFSGYEKYIHAFSYDINGAHQEDIDLAKKIASDFGILHSIDYGGGEINDSVVKTAVKNASNPYTGSKSVISYSFENFSDYGFSMRGNLGEISRGVFSARTAFINDAPKFMARIWRRGSENKKIIIDAFNDYVESTEVEKSVWPIRILYYWEHRHATWHSATVNELDTSFDTFNIMNSRNIIEAMCGVSLDSQKKCLVHKKTISILNPLLLDYPLKEKKF